MPKRRRYTPEQIITKLREVEVLQSPWMSVEEAVRTPSGFLLSTPHSKSKPKEK